jgi:hypothetical protein
MADAELAEQVEWFHQIACKTAEQLAVLATHENRARFTRYAKLCLPAHAPPETVPPEEFAACVLNLRENERGWNQALMTALVEADQVYETNESDPAAAALRSFAASCPWLQFQEVARTQACIYEARSSST